MFRYLKWNLFLALTTIMPLFEDTAMSSEASYIEMVAAEHQAENLSEFLVGAVVLVNKTEPGTRLWFALRKEDHDFAIFDVFDDENARDAHFSGVVAGALKVSSNQLVAGGWEDGVVANICNSSVLSEKAPDQLYTATTATYIKLKAAPGQGRALADLLRAAGPIVSSNEPETLYWVALQLDGDNFAIFDVFSDNSGREAHFAGDVASLLKKESDVLVEGGWEAGVVANVSNFDIIAIK